MRLLILMEGKPNLPNRCDFLSVISPNGSYQKILGANEVSTMYTPFAPPHPQHGVGGGDEEVENLGWELAGYGANVPLLSARPKLEKC